MGTMKRLITYFLLLVGFAYACAQDFGARTIPDSTRFPEPSDHELRRELWRYSL